MNNNTNVTHMDEEDFDDDNGTIIDREDRSNNNNNNNSKKLRTRKDEAEEGEEDSMFLISVLDLPVESMFGIDGQSLMIKTGDFVGIRGSYNKNKDKRNNWHLVTIRSNPSSYMTTGFFFCPTTTTTTKGMTRTDDANTKHNIITSINETNQQSNSPNKEKIIPYMVKRYDATIEEVSSKSVDELTIQNLWRQVQLATEHQNKQQQQISTTTKNATLSTTTTTRTPTLANAIPFFSNRLLDYSNVVSNEHHIRWQEQTSMIQYILSKRNIYNGEKIIPGSYRDEALANTTTTTATSPSSSSSDGKSIQYPPIPVVDTMTFPTFRANRHAGTKAYLSQLTPSQRTELFMLNNNSNNKHGNDNLTTSDKTLRTTTTTATIDTTTTISTALLQDVIQRYYDSNWKSLLGDLQLSYTLFLYMQCFSSLEHWKDLVAMLSLVDSIGIINHFSELYHSLLFILSTQIVTIDNGFLEDIDEDGNNFLIPSLQIMLQTLSKLKKNHTTSTSTSSNGSSSRNHHHKVPFPSSYDSIDKFQRLVMNKFPSIRLDEDNNDDNKNNRIAATTIPGGTTNTSSSTTTTTTSDRMMLVTDDMLYDNEYKDSKKNISFQKYYSDTIMITAQEEEEDEGNAKEEDNGHHHLHRFHPYHGFDDEEEEEDEEDGPVIVSLEEIEASFARSAMKNNGNNNNTKNSNNNNSVTTTTTNTNSNTNTDAMALLKQSYPLLVAAHIPYQHDEDIIMTCARILDEQKDVSLVREAAHYLENVENKYSK